MAIKDFHSSLNSNVIKNIKSPFGELAVAKLQWSKSEIAYTLHVAPGSYTASGFQTTDLLNILGFEKQSCTFLARRKCFVREVDEGFALENFASDFSKTWCLLVLGPINKQYTDEFGKAISNLKTGGDGGSAVIIRPSTSATRSRLREPKSGISGYRFPAGRRALRRHRFDAW